MQPSTLQILVYTFGSQWAVREGEVGRLFASSTLALLDARARAAALQHQGTNAVVLIADQNGDWQHDSQA